MASQGKSQRAKAAPAPGAKKQPARGPRRGQLARSFSMDSEQSARLLLIGGVALIVLIALGFIGFGYWNSVIKPRNRTVLEADGVKISYSAMKRRMAYEYAQNPLYDSSAQARQALTSITYGTLVDELAVINRAESDQGVTATDDEVGQSLSAKVNAVTTDQKAFAEALRNTLSSNGLHEDEFRRLTKAEVLTNKVRGKMQSELPATVPQAKVEVIQVATQDDAKKAADRVRAGEDWATVAKAVSQESDVGTTGGVHDYAPRGSFDTSYEDTAFSANVGEISQPIASTNGSAWFVIRVADRADKPLTDAQKTPYVTKEYNDWLSSARSEMTIVNHWDIQAQSDALLAVLQQAKPRVTPGIPTVAASVPQQQASPANPDTGGSSNPPVPNAPVAPSGQ